MFTYSLLTSIVDIALFISFIGFLKFVVVNISKYTSCNNVILFYKWNIYFSTFEKEIQFYDIISISFEEKYFIFGLGILKIGLEKLFLFLRTFFLYINQFFYPGFLRNIEQ